MNTSCKKLEFDSNQKLGSSSIEFYFRAQAWFGIKIELHKLSRLSYLTSNSINPIIYTLSFFFFFHFRYCFWGLIFLFCNLIGIECLCLVAEKIWDIKEVLDMWYLSLYFLFGFHLWVGKFGIFVWDLHETNYLFSAE